MISCIIRRRTGSLLGRLRGDVLYIRRRADSDFWQESGNTRDFKDKFDLENPCPLGLGAPLELRVYGNKRSYASLVVLQRYQIDRATGAQQHAAAADRQTQATCRQPAARAAR